MTDLGCGVHDLEPAPVLGELVSDGQAGLPAADIQFHMGGAFFEDHGREEFDGDAMVIGPVLVSPESRGSVRLRSADPAAKPRILTNSLAAPADDPVDHALQKIG